MPTAPAKPCKQPGCPTLTIGHLWCDEHRANRERYSNRQHRENSHRRGYDYDWRVFRDAYLRANPLCADCLDTEGRPEPATEVHHVMKLREHPERKYDRTNLMPLCSRHHKQRTARGE